MFWESYIVTIRWFWRVICILISPTFLLMTRQFNYQPSASCSECISIPGTPVMVVCSVTGASNVLSWSRGPGFEPGMVELGLRISSVKVCGLNQKYMYKPYLKLWVSSWSHMGQNYFLTPKNIFTSLKTTYRTYKAFYTSYNCPLGS